MAYAKRGDDLYFKCDQCRADRKLEMREADWTGFYCVAAFRSEPLDPSTLFLKKEVCGVACMTLVTNTLLGAFHRASDGARAAIVWTGPLLANAETLAKIRAEAPALRIVGLSSKS